MATKSKLERAVREQVENLNPAQRELVLSQFSVYMRNKRRMEEIESKLRIIDSTRFDPSTANMLLSQREALSMEHGQLSTANSSISAALFEQLKGEDGSL